MKKRLSVNKCNYKREEGHRILGSDMEMRAGYSPAWKVGVGFPEEVTSKVTSKPRMKGEKDLAKLRTGKSHGQGHLAPCSMARPVSHFHIKDLQDHFQSTRSMARPISHFHIKDPQDHFQKKKKKKWTSKKYP